MIFPGFWIALLTWFEFATALPFTRTITSPLFSPLVFAGLGLAIWSTVFVTLNCGGPDQKKAVRITTAVRMFAKGPAAITMTRRQTSARQ